MIGRLWKASQQRYARLAYRKLVRGAWKVFGYPVVYDVVRGAGRSGKRALLVYLVEPFMFSEDARFFREHQNRQQNLVIADVVARFGYTVDVMNHDDMHSNPRHQYDLLVGMGMGAWRLACDLPKDIPKVYLATGTQRDFNNEQELQRLDAVRRRRGCHLQPRRLAEFDPAKLSRFDAVACFGNSFTAATYDSDCELIYPFNNYGYTDIEYVDKDFESAKRNFLYFGAGGQVHKGLDLLLEVFADEGHRELYVCGPFRREKDFTHCYRRELFDTQNIHPVGWVEVGSEQFAELARRCAYVILPSCAEASAGSVVVCMHAGLIPVVSKECGISTRDFGLTLRDCSITTIQATVRDLSRRATKWTKSTSRATRRAATKDYSVTAFRVRWTHILSDLLSRVADTSAHAAWVRAPVACSSDH